MWQNWDTSVGNDFIQVLLGKGAFREIHENLHNST